MGRLHRIDPPDGWHHLMNRGVDHGVIFFDDVDRREFGRLLGLIYERFGIRIHAYCLMGNHYHLLVRCPDGQLSEAMHLFGSLFVRFVNDRTGRDGPLFRGRFHSKLITSVDYLANVLRYIHLNALDLAHVETVEQYRWSSHRTYLGLREPPPWLDLAHFMAWFDDDPSALHAWVTGVDLTDFTIGTGLGAAQLIDACETVVAERSTSRLTARHGETRALALVLADGSPDLRSEVHEALELSGGNLRTARHRATQIVERPNVAPLLISARRLLAA